MATGRQVNLPTLSLYKVGVGRGTVISSPPGINCGPQATCKGYFPLNSRTILTEQPDKGSSSGVGRQIAFR
jgi:hypothetical protein